MGHRVTLNVGGQVFDTSLTTLLRDPHSSVANIVQHDLQDTGCRSSFIDRDGTHFRHILNFLRDATCVLPASAESQQELHKEAEYFQVDGYTNGNTIEALLLTSSLQGWHVYEDQYLLQAQGLLNMLAAARKDHKIFSHTLDDLRSDLQEAKVIDRLRQQAGPALIQRTERRLIEKAFEPEPHGVNQFKRRIDLTNIDIPPEDHISYRMSSGMSPRRSLANFIGRYTMVFRYDLLKLGYTVTNDSLGYSCEYQGQNSLTLVSQPRAEPAAFGAVLTPTSTGLALRVAESA